MFKYIRENIKTDDNVLNTEKTLPYEIFPARVRKIILNNRDEDFDDFGQYNSLGLVFWESTTTPTKEILKENFALPLFPNFKNYPLINEVVYLISLPGPNLQNDLYDLTYYYFAPINMWQNVHQNALPDNIWQNLTPPSQNKSYKETEEGSVNKITGEEEEVNLGNTFTTKPIKDLQMFEGDVSIQGRWGNSIRFGSTVKSPLNDWSNSGENGEAITIIRNGQHENNEETWIPISENINKDKSSIYLTTSQKIPIEVASNSYNSYENAPTSPNEYVEDQVILNSGRLLFNSKTDSILLSSNKSINLNSINSINIDTSTLSIQSDKILLGNKDATEAVLLGDKTVEYLDKILTQLLFLSGALKTPYQVAGTAASNYLIQAQAQSLIDEVGKIKKSLHELKSQTSFTK